MNTIASATAKKTDALVAARAAQDPLRVEAMGSLAPRASETFVLTPEVERLTQRGLAYLAAGHPVHLAGPAGTGKTTLAFHIAAGIGRPVSLIHGNHEFGSSDLIGKDSGYSKSTVVDNYIHSVLKTKEDMSVKWMDNRLTVACEKGHTLVYDEFNRTTAEANNTLLSILEERILNLPRAGGGYLRVHPEFRVIFTSNPDEYAGVHRTQDALLDRMITIQVDHYDAETERYITATRGGIDEHTAGVLVHLARSIRATDGANQAPTIRACIAAARVLVSRRDETNHANPLELDQFARDVLWDVFGGVFGDRCEEIALRRAAFDRLVDQTARGVIPDKAGGRGAPETSKPRLNAA